MRPPRHRRLLISPRVLAEPDENVLCRLDDLWLFSSPAERWERLASLDVGGTIQTPHDWLLNLALA